MYRPQFTIPDPPEGWEWQPCMYEFDTTNTPAFVNLNLQPDQETQYIPLKLDDDAPFVLASIEIQFSGVNVQVRDPWSNELQGLDINQDGTELLQNPDLFATQSIPAAVLEGPWLYLPSGAVMSVKLQGQTP